jgi:hypothetical protein
MWNMGSAVQIRSSGVRKKRVCLVPSAKRIRASWLSSAPFGSGRGAGGVHDHGGVADLDQLAAELQVAVWPVGPGRGEVSLGGEAGRAALAQDDDLAQVRRVVQGQRGAILAVQGGKCRRQQGREIGRHPARSVGSRGDDR